MNPEPTRVHRSLVNAVSALLLVSVLGIVMFAVLRSPLKDDIAWLLYVARRWLAGKELYVDVIEINPPLIIWISALPLSLARWLGVGQQYVAMPAFAAAALACAWWSACLLRPRGGLFAHRMPVFATIGCVLLIVPAADLGQREHLLVAAFLPYLILFARTIDGGRPPVPTSVAVGILAALGCALKPQYGLALAALEIAALRHWVTPWRAAPIAAAATLIGYVGLVALVCPAYLLRAVPMAMALYGATDVTFRVLFLDSAPLLAAEALAVFLWWRDRRTMPERSLLMTGIVFAAVSSLICFIDGKDWFYHRLPATVLTVLMLILWTAATVARRPVSGLPRRALTVAGLAVALFCVTAVQRLQPAVSQAVEPQVTTVARLEALIRLHRARTYIAFSEWIALGFPVVNNTGVIWASRFDSMWALKGEMWRAHIDPVAAKEWPIAHWVAHDFIAGCPDLAVVDTRKGANYIGVLTASEPAFARAWSRYKPIVAFDGLTVYKRGKGGCVDPWVAAEAPGVGTAVR
ncbi:MAG: hypothetical protein EXR07_12420 [Acetobacteraceae bacterium]|nr:hypothetical protein [Acetobacteraceae bacterium]